MLGRLAGNHALKQDLNTALRSGRLPHSILLVGEPGCGAGFAARCLGADYLYPQGGAHAEAVLRGQDSECLTIRGEGLVTDEGYFLNRVYDLGVNASRTYYSKYAQFVTTVTAIL